LGWGTPCGWVISILCGEPEAASAEQIADEGHHTDEDQHSKKHQKPSKQRDPRLGVAEYQVHISCFVRPAFCQGRRELEQFLPVGPRPRREVTDCSFANYRKHHKPKQYTIVGGNCQTFSPGGLPGHSSAAS
jgi:hypothetical protein